MDDMKREIQLEDMEKVSGGNGYQADRYMKHLLRKYDLRSVYDVKRRWTQEEKDYYTYVLDWQPEDGPMKPYPD